MLTAAFDRIVIVPAISRFLGIVIAMFFDDHGPPHFHARDADGSAKIRIDTLEPIETTLVAANCGWCSPGPNCTKKNCSRTGASRAPVKHFRR